MYRKPKITINSCDWPPNNGCCGAETTTKLYVGNHIDRFGSNNGFFFGVAGEPYIYRSLPWFGNYIPKNPKNNNKIRAKYYKFYSEGDKENQISQGFASFGTVTSSLSNETKGGTVLSH